MSRASDKMSMISSTTASPQGRFIHYCYNTPLQISGKTNQNLLSLVTLLISCAYAIQNVWITALMISFGTPNIVDAFVWIIPNILAIIIKPYIVRYVNLAQITMNREIRIIFFCLLASGIGCLLVGFSIQFSTKQYFAIRILICTVGWTLMDASMEIAEYFIQKMNDFLDNNFKIKKKLSDQIIQTIGSVSVYVVTYGMLNSSSKLSLKIFTSICRKQYYAVGFSTLIIAVILRFVYDLPAQAATNMKLPSKFVEENQNTTTHSFYQFRSIQSYLPGILEFKYASKHIKLMLLVHFCVAYMADIVLIYATMWLFLKAKSKGHSQGASYCIGMRDGSLALAAFTIVAQGMLTNIKGKRIFEGILCVSICFTVLGYIWREVIWIYSISIAMGICVGYYRKQIQPIWEENHPVYATCLQLVQRVEKIFVLCIMPFVIMIVLERDDIVDCIAVAVIMLGLALFAVRACIDIQERIQNRLSKMAKDKFN